MKFLILFLLFLAFSVESLEVSYSSNSTAELSSNQIYNLVKANRKDVLDLIEKELDRIIVLKDDLINQNIDVTKRKIHASQIKSYIKSLKKIAELIQTHQFNKALHILRRLNSFFKEVGLSNIKLKLQNILDTFSKQISLDAAKNGRYLPQELSNLAASYSNIFPGFEPSNAFETNTDFKSEETVLLANNDNWLIYANQKGIEIFDLTENKVIKKLDEYMIRSMDYDPTYNLLVFSTYNKIVLYDCTNWKIIAEKNLGDSYAPVVKFSRNYKFIFINIIKFMKNEILIYNNDLNQPFKRQAYVSLFDGPANYPSYNLKKISLDHKDTYSYDNKYFATIKTCEDIVIYNSNKTSVVAKLTNSDFILSIAFSPDEKWFAAAGDNKNIKIWRTTNWKCVQTLDLHKNEVYSVVFSQDSKKLVSCSDNLTIIWELSE